MKNFTLEILDDQFSKVSFYTVRWENDEKTETDKFILKFSKSIDYKHFYQQIAALLQDMGERKGARKHYFTRHEDEASALPPKGTWAVNGIEIEFYENPLRLYCTRLNDHLVVLFNGGLKTARTAQESADLAQKFRDAKQFAKRIWQAIQDEMVEIDKSNRRILNFDGSDDEIFL